MMNMRPFQIIILVVFAVLAVGGLFLFATYKGFGGSTPVGEVTIWGTLPAGAMTETVNDLRTNHQEFGKVTYSEHSEATFDTELANAIASGNGPDLIVLNQEHLLSLRSKLTVIPTATISERTYRDRYVPITELFLTQGGTFAMPFVIDPVVLFYNRSLLSSAGVPQVPTTWEGIVGLAERLTVKSDAGLIAKSAIPLGTYENIPHARAIVSLLLLQAGSPIVQFGSGVGRSTLGVGSDSFSRTLADTAIAFYTQFADPAKLVYSWSRSQVNARQSFLAGDAAFYVGLASERKLIAAGNPNLDFDMASVPQPQTATTKVDYALAYGFSVPRGSRNAAGAVRTAVALSDAPSEKIAAPALGVAPALRSELAASGDIYSPIVNAAALRAKGWLSPAPAVVDRIFADMINAIITGRQGVHEAILSADEALTAALN